MNATAGWGRGIDRGRHLARDVSNCSTWNGLHRVPSQPLRCGVLWYMQIDNTGGSAVTHWLKQQAAKRNVSYTELFSLDFHQNWTDWNASEPKLPDGSRCATDTEYCCVACVADAWKRLLLLLQQPRAKCTKGHRQNEPLPPQQQHDGEALALLLSQ